MGNRGKLVKALRTPAQRLARRYIPIHSGRAIGSGYAKGLRFGVV